MTSKPGSAKPKKRGLMIGVMVGVPKPGAAAPKGPLDPDEDEDEDPMQAKPALADTAPAPTHDASASLAAPGGGGGTEPDADDAGRPAIDPDDVGCHSEAESCTSCNFMQGASCYWLQMPVGPGTEIIYCTLYKPKDEMVADAGLAPAMAGGNSAGAPQAA